MSFQTISFKTLHTEFLLYFEKIVTQKKSDPKHVHHIAKSFIQMLPGNDEFQAMFKDAIRYENVPPFSRLSQYTIIVEVPFKASHHHCRANNFIDGVTIGIGENNESPLFPIANQLPTHVLLSHLSSQRRQHHHSAGSPKALILRLDGRLIYAPKNHISLFQYSLHTSRPFHYFNGQPLTPEERKRLSLFTPLTPLPASSSFLDNSL